MPRSANPHKRIARRIGALQRQLLDGGITMLADDGEGMIGVVLAPLNMRRITEKEREQLTDGRQIIRRADGSGWLLADALKTGPHPLLHEALTNIEEVNRGELPETPEAFSDYVLALDVRRDGRR